MDISVVRQLFLRGSKNGKNFQKNKVVTGKTPLFVISLVHFAVVILFVLTLVPDRPVMSENDVLSILVISTKKSTPVF